MDLYEFSDRYEVGIRQIDEQHKVLFDLINQLHEAVLAGREKEAMGNILPELLRYTSTHFTSEERLMKRHKYGQYEAHKRKHEEFIQEVRRHVDELNTGGRRLGTDLMRLISDWIIDHIGRTDRQLARHLKEQGVL